MSGNPLQERIGYTKTPMDPGGNGEAFAGFVHFAIGNSEPANCLRAAFRVQHTSPADESTKQLAAAFVDWLIVTQWGEA